MRPCLWLLAALLSAVPVRALDQGFSLQGWADAYHDGSPDAQGWLRFTYTLHAPVKPWLFFEVTAIVEGDTHGSISRDRVFDADDRDLERAAARFRDLAVGFRAGDVTIVVGRQRLTWGRATFVNAGDNLAPRDWTDPLEEVRLSPWSADVAWERGRWHAETALVPLYAPSRLPQLGSRWFADPAGTTVSWGAASFPPVTWGTQQGAARGGYRGTHGEVTASYFAGYDDAPRLIPRVGPPDPVTGLVPVTLDRRFARLEVASLDGEWLAGSWIVRGEAGYFHYPGGEDGYGLYEVEAEWTSGAWRTIAGFGDTAGAARLAIAATALDVAVLPAAFLGVRYGEATEWQVGLDATVGTDDGDSLVRLSGSTPLGSHVRVGGEADVLSGGATTFWGRWRDNDRLRVFVKCDF